MNRPYTHAPQQKTLAGLSFVADQGMGIDCLSQTRS
jgi:hypothetical protein